MPNEGTMHKPNKTSLKRMPNECTLHMPNETCMILKPKAWCKL